MCLQQEKGHVLGTSLKEAPRPLQAFSPTTHFLKGSKGSLCMCQQQQQMAQKMRGCALGKI